MLSDGFERWVALILIAEPLGTPGLASLHGTHRRAPWIAPTQAATRMPGASAAGVWRRLPRALASGGLTGWSPFDPCI